jgi:hypothetical protein
MKAIRNLMSVAWAFVLAMLMLTMAAAPVVLTGCQSASADGGGVLGPVVNVLSEGIPLISKSGAIQFVEQLELAKQFPGMTPDKQAYLDVAIGWLNGKIASTPDGGQLALAFADLPTLYGAYLSAIGAPGTRAMVTAGAQGIANALLRL